MTKSHVKTIHYPETRVHRALSSVAAGLTVTAMLVVGLTAPASAATRETPSQSGNASNSLTVSGNTVEPIPDSFNPYVLTSGGNLIDAEPMIYETLLQFDLLKPGTIYDWLASSYQFSNADKTLTFDLRKGVTWTDGTPLTSADVVYSFDLQQKYASLNTNGDSFSSVRADGPDKVVFTFSKADYPQLYDIASTYIVPEHIWKSVNPMSYADTHPVGTGPYTVERFSPEDLVLTKNPHYWQPGEPKITQLNYPAWASADADNRDLVNGTETWAGNYIPEVQRVYVDQNPKYRHYWFAPVGVVALLPNLAVYPLNILAVREAISDAINRQSVSTEGESTYEAPATSPTGLVLPYDDSVLAPQYKDLKFTLNDAKAKQLMESAGFTMKNGYFVGKNGKPITLNLIDPSSYSDYMTDALIISSNLKAIGIKVNVSGISVNAWTSDYFDGDFQLTILYSNIGPSPYYWYNGWLNDALSAPVGKTATADFSRWYSAATQSALAQYTTGVTTAARNAGIMAIEKVMVEDEPVIPLVYSAVWFEYDNQYVGGWPTPSNPYAMGEPAGLDAEITLMHLSPR